MSRVKLAAVIILALLMAFFVGSSDVREAGEIQTPESAAAPVPELVSITEPAPVHTYEREPVTTPDPSAEMQERAQIKAAAQQEQAPMPVLELPDIPDNTPALPQIKSLPSSGMVCLTFDDGNGEASIENILDCLRDYDVQCTFFVIGTCLERYPELWRRAAAAGHEIAYHTMKHRSLNKCTNEQIVKDINQWNETVRSVLGPGYVIPRIARAPGGKANARVRRLFSCLGYKLIYWSSDTYTGVYKKSRRNAGERVASYIIDRTQEGSISLQHFNRYDALSLPRYIETIKSNFKLGTVSEALEASAEHSR